MDIKIIPQGLLDGACLLYAMVNAGKALIGPTLSVRAFGGRYRIYSRWKQIVSVTPSPINYLDRTGSGIGLRLSLEQQVNDAFFAQVFNILSTNQHKFRVQRISLKSFRQKTDYRSGVVVFAVTDKGRTKNFSGSSHWMVAVGRQTEPSLLYLACSSSLHFSPYQEQQDPETHRFYNNSMKIDQLDNVFCTAIYQVEIILC